MLVKKIMTRDVQTIEPGTTVREAAEKMAKFSIGCLLVVSGGRLAGIVTESDILRKVVAEGLDGEKTKVRTIMTKEVIYIDPKTDVEDAADIMLENGIKKLPVVDGHTLVGIVTVTDMCRVEPKMVEKVYRLLFGDEKKLEAG
ncbi:MAG: CBS domain-containing protein [Candidatus Aenigmarchaeota archaeon]|nr:CBS domain-containing protein [Candidatus Aenigmarchaeota archaeon]